ncbi:MAG TPA: disulfide oxidoreductase [Eubacterium sp.]|jgi:hybrid cluster-associated redox disulfide protein|nr:DUF1858 domain-containing protein [Lachnospiraceae bacterium]HAZ91234.1 disulfide oxidoreductase [Eubacterium sp.]HBZ53680.1 disulfide oxidoreductase [Eubacterium sp.]
MEKITKDTIIKDAITIEPDIVNIFMSSGMHCITCPAALGETIEEAAYVHGIDIEDLMLDIEDYLKLKKESELL